MSLVHKIKALSLISFKYVNEKIKLFKGNCKEKTLCHRGNLGSPALVSATSRNLRSLEPDVVRCERWNVEYLMLTALC